MGLSIGKRDGHRICNSVKKVGIAATADPEKAIVEAD